MQVKSYAHGPDSSDSLVIDLAMFISSQNGKRDPQGFPVLRNRGNHFVKFHFHGGESALKLGLADFGST